ncbi:MBL fold metallo-hydrolase [archaeon]|jgi:ribonuclease J|nr:MBL fold metallo-hydrolase [archaeon]MBT3730803.1 MBL fold metallo-hydrolase [archaeon]MBT4670117.1 MBL fold metallo-hydrolase [archaeon]MBT5030582.1 MBL fold metallo-hydrolase [archaeon]MBT5287935.1 MBL fold metallo-hydrolase [archaeon]
MSLKVKFYGGALKKDWGELGGVQILFHDTDADTRFFFDFGQRPDHYNRYYGFPYKPARHSEIEIAKSLALAADFPGIYRLDGQGFRDPRFRKPGIDGIVCSHAHYDHIGEVEKLRPDIKLFYHKHGATLARLWQKLSGRTVNQFLDYVARNALVPNTQGGLKFASGDLATIERAIVELEDEERVKIGNIYGTPYLVDHSLPGATGWIFETSAGKVAVSGDIRFRGRRRGDTEKFIEALHREKIDYFFVEGSLLHFDHQGTEEDVTSAMIDQLKDVAFAAVAYPPRDFDRMTSMYYAAKATGRMLVVDAAQGEYLSKFNGVNGYPKLNDEYIGIYMPKLRYGLIDSEYPQEMVERDYRVWQRHYLDPKRKWDGNKKKVQRVSIQDMKKNQDKFLVYIPANHLVAMLEEIQPKEGSKFIRSHPGPWTKSMEVDEARQIEVLDHYNMLTGPKLDVLNGTQSNITTVHITGHWNKEEYSEVLRELDCLKIMYHTMIPKLSAMYASRRRQIIPQIDDVLIPVRGKQYEF